jgi:hypothetical protein
MSHFDLHITMILPEDITERVSSFTFGNTIFPSVKRTNYYHSYTCMGRDNVVLEKPERVLESQQNC